MQTWCQRLHFRIMPTSRRGWIFYLLCFHQWGRRTISGFRIIISSCIKLINLRLTILFYFLARLSVAQVDTLWECLARDPKCSDDLFVWLTNQVRSRDQHALSHETFRHILMAKLPSHPPESITMHSLTLFQQLCNLARLAVLQDVELVAGGTPVASMDYLWKIALYAHNTDVSLMAIQYLNNYYIGRQLEKEEEFVER